MKGNDNRNDSFPFEEEIIDIGISGAGWMSVNRWNIQDIPAECIDNSEYVNENAIAGLTIVDVKEETSAPHSIIRGINFLFQL